MKIFLSSYVSSWKNLDKNLLGQANLLNDFPEMGGLAKRQRCLSVGKSFFLDSGGYSIRIRGLNLSVNDYISYIKKYGDCYSTIANMDTVNVKETIENQKRIEGETGRKILPVYHASDFCEGNIKLLEYYLSHYDYIALGGVAGVANKDRTKDKKIMKYLMTVFSKAKQTKTKIHGFGMTTDSVLKSLPFYSVDSTSWHSGVRYNVLYVFTGGKLKNFDLDKGKNKLGVNYALLSNNEKLNRNLKARLDYEKYITKLQQIKGMEYRL